MSPVATEVILFVIGLICLVKGGDWFVDGATGIAHRFNMPEILIGATVVSIGTTIPEVMVSSTAALTEGASAIAYGNAIGSVICNTSLIAAITMAFMPGIVERKAIKTPVVFFFIAAVFYAAVAYISGSFTRPVGIVLLIMFLIYMFAAVRQARVTDAGFSQDAAKAAAVSAAEGADGTTETAADTKDNTAGADSDGKENESGLVALLRGDSVVKEIIFLVAGAAVIAVGADLLVDNGTLLAEAAGVPQSVIALTFVALGTSLPELVTAITSLIKGHSDLSLGNVIGANLFNLVLVSGLAVTLSPFKIPVEKTIAGMNASLVVDVPVMFAVMLIMCLPALIKGKLYRAQGIILMLIYAAYVAFQFIG